MTTDRLRACLVAMEGDLKRLMASWEYAFAMGGKCHGGGKPPRHRATRAYSSAPPLPAIRALGWPSTKSDGHGHSTPRSDSERQAVGTSAARPTVEPIVAHAQAPVIPAARPRSTADRRGRSALAAVVPRTAAVRTERHTLFSY